MEDTRISHISTAIDNVFGIAELAEKILLECRIKDLLINCQRVSKQWNGIISFSKKLQQALFFQPLPGYRVCYVPYGMRGADGDDGKAFFADEHQSWREPDYYDIPRPEFYDTEDEVTEEQRRRWQQNERTLVFANPFLDAVYHKGQTYCAPPAYVADAFEDYEERRKKMAKIKPSWWRMFACQPPVYELFFNSLDERSGREIECFDYSGIKILATINNDREFADRPTGFEHMAPVTFAKDVRRINYFKGDYEFEKCELDLW